MAIAGRMVINKNAPPSQTKIKCEMSGANQTVSTGVVTALPLTADHDSYSLVDEANDTFSFAPILATVGRYPDVILFDVNFSDADTAGTYREFDIEFDVLGNGTVWVPINQGVFAYPVIPSGVTSDQYHSVMTKLYADQATWIDKDLRIAFKHDKGSDITTLDYTLNIYALVNFDL